MRRLFLGLALVGGALIGLARIAAAQETIADPSAVVIPKFVDETASAGIDSVYKGEWQYMVGGGVAAFDCSGDGFPDMLLVRRRSAGEFYRNVSKRGGPLRFELAEERPRTGQGDRRLSDRHRRRRHHRSRAPARRRQRRDARPRRLQVRARQRKLGLRRRRRLVDRLRCDLGARRRVADASPSAITSTVTRRSRPGGRAPTTGSSGRASSTASRSAGSGRRWR